MSHKAKFSFLLLTCATFGVLFLFNNCQPMNSVSEDSSSTGTGGGGGTPPPPPGSGGASAQTYFGSSVLPQLNQSSRCANCHVTQPRLVGPGGVFATANIYNYTFMRTLILQGPTAVNNPVYNRTRGTFTPHTSITDYCPGDQSGSVSPCRELKTWALMENPLLTDGIGGTVNFVSPLGQVSGYAIDTKNPNVGIQVVVYVNGPVGTGQLVGTYPANLPGAGAGNGHAFNFTLPAQYRDGTQRQLYVYGISAVPANLLPSGGFAYTAYTPSAAGMEHFNNEVGPRLGCGNCHGNWTYEAAFERLVSPLPTATGTSTNNTLINKMSGMNHSGGNQCPGGKNANPCAAVRDWWLLEFN